MSKTGALVKNTLTIAFGKLSTQFLTFLLLPLYTAFLSTSQFGTVDLIMTYVMLLAPSLTLQMEMAVFRFLVDERKNETGKRRVISGATQVVVVAALSLVMIFLFLNLFLPIPHGWLALGVVLSVIVSNFFLQIARGFGDNLKYSLGGVFAGVTTIVGNIVFIVFMHMGADGMLLASLLGNVLCAVFLFVTLGLYRYIDLAIHDNHIQRKLIGYSAPLIPNGVSWWVVNAADRTIITILLGVASNGIYAVAYKFPAVFNSLFSFFGMSWTESASVHINSKDRDHFFSDTMNASMRLFGCMAIGMVALMPFIFPLFVGERYKEAYLYIPVLLVGSFFNSVVGLYSAIYIAKKQTRQVLTSSLIAAGVSIGLTLLLMGKIGLYAPAIAMVMGYASMAVYRHYDVKKFVKLRYDIGPLGVMFVTFLGVMWAYYSVNTAWHVAGLLVALAVSAWVNRSIMQVLVTKLKTRRVLGATQQVEQDITEQK